MTEEEVKKSYLNATETELRELVYLLNERLKPLEAAMAVNEGVSRESIEFIKKTVIEAVEEVTGIALVIMQQKTKKYRVVRPRQLVMHFLSKQKGINLMEIDSIFGGDDHSRVIAASKKIQDLVEVKDEYVYPLYVKANLLINGRINSYNQHRTSVHSRAKGT